MWVKIKLTYHDHWNNWRNLLTKNLSITQINRNNVFNVSKKLRSNGYLALHFLIDCHKQLERYYIGNWYMYSIHEVTSNRMMPFGQDWFQYYFHSVFSSTILLMVLLALLVPAWFTCSFSFWLKIHYYYFYDCLIQLGPIYS